MNLTTYAEAALLMTFVRALTNKYEAVVGDKFLPSLAHLTICYATRMSYHVPGYPSVGPNLPVIIQI